MGEAEGEKDWKVRACGGLPHNCFLNMTGSCHLRPHNPHGFMDKTCTKLSQTELQHDLGEEGLTKSHSYWEKRQLSLKMRPLIPKGLKVWGVLTIAGDGPTPLYRLAAKLNKKWVSVIRKKWLGAVASVGRKKRSIDRSKHMICLY